MFLIIHILTFSSVSGFLYIVSFELLLEILEGGLLMHGDGSRLTLDGDDMSLDADIR